jgi:hypothetical protein
VRVGKTSWSCESMHCRIKTDDCTEGNVTKILCSAVGPFTSKSCSLSRFPAICEDKKIKYHKQNQPLSRINIFKISHPKDLLRNIVLIRIQTGLNMQQQQDHQQKTTSAVAGIAAGGQISYSKGTKQQQRRHAGYGKDASNSNAANKSRKGWKPGTPTELGVVAVADNTVNGRTKDVCNKQGRSQRHSAGRSNRYGN